MAKTKSKTSMLEASLREAEDRVNALEVSLREADERAQTAEGTAAVLEAQLQETTEELEAIKEGAAELAQLVTWLHDEKALLQFRAINTRDLGEHTVARVRVDGDIEKQLPVFESYFAAACEVVQAARERLERRRARIGVN